MSIYWRDIRATESGIPQDGMGALVESKWTDGIHDNLEVSNWTEMKRYCYVGIHVDDDTQVSRRQDEVLSIVSAERLRNGLR